MPKEQPNYRKLVLDALPGTVKEISLKSKIATKTVRRWLAVLMNPGRDRQVRIVEWVRREKGPPVPVYGKGAEPSEPRPGGYTPAERMARHRASARAMGKCPLEVAEERHRILSFVPDYRQDPFLFWVPSRCGLEVRA